MVLLYYHHDDSALIAVYLGLKSQGERRIQEAQNKEREGFKRPIWA